MIIPGFGGRERIGLTIFGKCNPVSLYLAKVKFALSESEE